MICLYVTGDILGSIRHKAVKTLTTEERKNKTLNCLEINQVRIYKFIRSNYKASVKDIKEDLTKFEKI